MSGRRCAADRGFIIIIIITSCTAHSGVSTHFLLFRVKAQAIDFYGDGTTMRKNFIRHASTLVVSNMRMRMNLIWRHRPLWYLKDENET